jgi:hypothetical protein
MITYEELMERLSYNPETGIFIWHNRKLTKPQDKTWNKKFAGKSTGYIRHNGYQIINISGREYACSRLAWMITYKKWPANEIDHINGIRSDNRIANLRAATRSENASNRNLQSNNTTGFKGVWKRKNMNSWVATIQKCGQKIRLGSFDSPEKAGEAYLRAVNDIHGEFARP